MEAKLNTEKIIMVPDYRARCCGTCQNGIEEGPFCYCEISGKAQSRYGICMTRYQERVK